MSLYHLQEKVRRTKVEGRKQQNVPEVTSQGDERLKTMVNSCMSKEDRLVGDAR